MSPALSGHGIMETMAVKRDRINNKAISPSSEQKMGRNELARTDAAIQSIARLIGRQIAREQFERKIAMERKVQKQHHTKPLFSS